MKFRPRFSLRTLFIAVALLSIPMGWLVSQRSLVVKRQQFLAELRHNGGYYYDQDSYSKPESWLPSIPFWRHAMGDRACVSINLPIDWSQDMADSAIDLFPETPFILYQKPENRSISINLKPGSKPGARENSWITE